MAEDLYEQYAGLFSQQVDLVEEALVGVIRSALGDFSGEFKRNLRSLVQPRRPSATSGPPSTQRQLTRAQEEIEVARDSTQRQIATALANGFGALAQLPAALDYSANQPTVPATQATVDVITANNNADNSDDDSMSIKSEDSSECESDCESHSDETEIKEEAIEEDPNEIVVAATMNVNLNNDNVSIKTEIESECDSSDSDSSDEEEEELTTGRGIKEEIEDDHLNDQVMGDSVDENEEVQAIGEQQEENQTRSIDNTNLNDYNFETVNSNETNSDQQSDAMMTEDDEVSNEQDLADDGPTIIVVNYDEFDVRSIESSVNQDTVLGGSTIEELQNIAEPDGDFVENFESNQGHNEQQSEAMVIDGEENREEASNEQDQNRPTIGAVSYPASTSACRSTRVSAEMAVNYSEASENSVVEQQGSSTGSRKRKRSIRRSGKSTAPKRTRNVPSREVAAQLEHQVNDDSGEEDESESESEDIPLSIIVRRLKCCVPGCKKMFKNKVRLDSHLLAKHAIEKYACKVTDCNESYATRAEFKVHRDSVHGHLGNSWPCGQCETTCHSYKKLRDHVNLYHEEGQFACSDDKCNYTETTRIKVQNHHAKHRPAKHRCTYAGCASSFYGKSNLTRHFRTHTKERPFLCLHCPKAFSQKTDLTRHELIHFGLKPYSCTWPHCDYSANQKSPVITHVRMVHFHLPQTKKEQTERNIIDNRDPHVFVAKSAIPSN